MFRYRIPPIALWPSGGHNDSEIDSKEEENEMKKVLLLPIVFLCFLFLESASGAFVEVHKGKANGVEYMTGGVGVGERQAMEEMAKGFNLKAVFAVVAGNYLADVSLRIMKPTGEMVLETVSTGPYFYARLPEGRYRFVAVHKGIERAHSLEIGRDLKTVMFHWAP